MVVAVNAARRAGTEPAHLDSWSSVDRLRTERGGRTRSAVDSLTGPGWTEQRRDCDPDHTGAALLLPKVAPKWAQNGHQSVSKAAIRASYGAGLATPAGPSGPTPYASRPANHLESPVSHTTNPPPADRLVILIERCAQGDEQAFAQFYEMTTARAFGLALRVLKNPALAEEVTQEAYLEAWRRSGRYDQSRGSVVAWLLTLVHRRAVDRVRATQASTRRDAAYQRRELAADTDTTSVAALAFVEAQQVRAAMSELSPTQRQAIRLAYFDGLSQTEVAARVGAPLGTVKFWIRGGLRKMRSALEAVDSQAA